MMETVLRLPNTSQSTCIKFTVFGKDEIYKSNENKLSNIGFMVSDIIRIIREHEIKGISCVVNINAIHVHKLDRGNDCGFRLFGELLRYLDIYGLRDRRNEKDKNAIILIKASPLIIDYPEEPDRETHKAELVSQANWLERHGFRNINSLCNFENGIPYMYINTDSYDVLHAIIKEEVDKYY